MQLQVFLIYLITFIDLFAVGLVVPFISPHVLALGGSHFVVGLMASFYSGFQLFSGPLIGSLSDVKGRCPILIITILGCSIAYIVFGFVSSIYILLLLRLTLGFLKHTQTLAKAFVTDIVKPEDHSEVYGKMAAISGIGISLGPTVGGHISEDYPEFGFTLTCIITSILFIINAGTVYYMRSKIIMIDDSKHSRKTDGPETIKFTSIVVDSWKKSINELKEVDWENYWDIFLLKALASFSMSIFYSNYSPLLKTVYGLSPKWIGYTISFQGGIGALSSYFIKYINKKFYKNDVEYSQRNMHCFILLSTTFLCMIVCNQWVLFAMLSIPLAVGNAVLRLVGLEMIIQKCPKNQRGSLIGASTSVRAISGTVAPMIAGYLGDLIGVQFVISVSFLTVFSGVAVLLSRKRAKNKLETIGDKKQK